MEPAVMALTINEIIFIAMASVFLYLLGCLLFPDIHSGPDGWASIGLEAAMGVELGLAAHKILMNDHRR